jgi:cytochrome b subunit of formate dehydrogenase
LPEQGKFNVAEKINFMMLKSTYFLYIITGMFICITDEALLSWTIHFGMALIATPLLISHKFMALVNPETRIGLSGMISGFVDRQWGNHYHTR